ncbi:ubiquinol-cytochrome c reductase iron-sulfur subunit [Roseospirillum parvum]|uniref:Ubiquinol-cytochrome c reductase iron-sulfur subunit n=1 Tax=Roseospirillum parvum TaxID=83401 RepID=A0A1G7WFI4_9PROT|nr:ubiquinol-cytochrome c reductase iron-sulfur subunit [Roseospirillum parvum]SDG70624.1 ubiquinol-cytochrome c reductase iron-sulfur subunit [Roseospirillum parvum]
MAETATPEQLDTDGESRRDFLLYATSAVGGVGTLLAIWPFIDSMSPAADTLALSSIEVDLSMIEVGQAIKVKWRGQPVFIRHRTEEEISAAQSQDISKLRDPEPDEARVQNPEWLIVIGICTHLGCIPLGTKEGEPRGDWNGWYCPCHGSHYDTAGRIRKGPAPRNLDLPEYTFLDDATVKIG